MKIELKGNTYQETYEGYNLFGQEVLTIGGVYEYYQFKELDDNSEYTLSIKLKDGGTQQNMYVGLANETSQLQTYSWLMSNGNINIGVLQPDGFRSIVNHFSNKYVSYLVIYRNNISLKNLFDNYDIQLVKGSTYKPYQEYVGGTASPNPKYPQRVQTVSGDNTIRLTNKNIFTGDFSQFDNQGGSGTLYGYFKVPDETKTYTMTMIAKNDFTPTNNTFIGFTKNGGESAGGVNWLVYQNLGPVSKGTILRKSNIYNGVKQNYVSIFTKNENTLKTFTDNFYIQLEEGEGTSYEPHKITNYQVNLGVENLWKNQLTGFIPVTGDYPTTHSSYPNSRYILVPLLKGQSVTLSNSTYGYGRCRYIDMDTNQSVGTIIRQGPTANDYYTSTADFSNGFAEGTITAKKDFIVGVMDLRSGENDLVVNYGGKQTISDNPIELCKIGNYQDRFIRNSGKNLFDINSEKSDFSASVYKYEYNLKPNTQYTISSNCPSSNTANIYANSTSSSQKVHINNPQTITSDSNGYFYILVRHVATGEDSGTFNVYQAILDGTYWLQIEEGNSATDYEPYGNGDWYLEKKIGKLIFDGTENGWSIGGSTGHSLYAYNSLTNFVYKGDLPQLAYCNYFTSANVGSSNDVLGFFMVSSGVLRFREQTMKTLANWKTWLESNNLIFYYVYETPTYTKIEGELANQLDKLSGAKSYNSQTNISQENNDLASILNATALSE